ncbi:MAG: hypothetical protein KA164_22855 [Rhodoferax sp.]|nr:hypothetical protein [Rhodoferax sp.]
MNTNGQRVTALAAALTLILANGSAYAGMDGPGGKRIQRGAVDPARVERSAASARSLHSWGHWQQRVLSQWAEGFTRWIYSVPLGVSPVTDTTGAHCGANQEGPVWFLTVPIGVASPFSRTCVVPHGKAIFTPIAAYPNTYPCPNPAFQPAPGQSIDDFLAGDAALVAESYSLVEATLNGVPLQPRRVTTRSFRVSAAVDLSAVDGCVTGSMQTVLVDGHFIAIDPLPRGDHLLQVRSNSAFFGVTEGSFLLQVR